MTKEEDELALLVSKAIPYIVPIAIKYRSLNGSIDYMALAEAFQAGAKFVSDQLDQPKKETYK